MDRWDPVTAGLAAIDLQDLLSLSLRESQNWGERVAEHPAQPIPGVAGSERYSRKEVREAAARLGDRLRSGQRPGRGDLFVILRELRRPRVTRGQQLLEEFRRQETSARCISYRELKTYALNASAKRQIAARRSQSDQF